MIIDKQCNKPSGWLWCRHHPTCRCTRARQRDSRSSQVGRGKCCLSALIISLSLLLKASQGDIGHAVGLLTTQPAEVRDPGEPQEAGTSEEAWEGQKGTGTATAGNNQQQLSTFKFIWKSHWISIIINCVILHPIVSSGIRKDELQTAIELSLQESHNAQEEEREFHRYKKLCDSGWVFKFAADNWDMQMKTVNVDLWPWL